QRHHQRVSGEIDAELARERGFERAAGQLAEQGGKTRADLDLRQRHQPGMGNRGKIGAYRRSMAGPQEIADHEVIEWLDRERRLAKVSEIQELHVAPMTLLHDAIVAATAAARL